MSTTTDAAADSRPYTIISSDGHAGADLHDYKPYLASRWHDDFDAWAPTYVNPFADLQAPTAYRSWDSARRLEETEADGIAQVQGVWLAPHLRGRALAAPAMAEATRQILDTHEVVSLYVNDFNTRAVRTYLRCGFTVAGEFATVLY